MDLNENHLFLKTKVKPILEPLFVDVARHKPEDLVDFCIQWLQEHDRKAKQH